ncbi:hypothetical protein CN507_07620 [Bacillus cereus]|nr:hypothetical protein CN507_07620 [Bacillus cereus]
MNKKLILSGIVVSTLLGGTINNVYADQVQRNNHLQYTNTGEEGALKDIDNTLEMVAKSISDGSTWGFRLIDGGTVKYSGINLEETNVTNVVPMFFGSNTFFNETTEEQTYNTGQFQHEVTHETSTSTQNGFTTGLTVGGKTGIPFVAEGSVETHLEYNFSNTDTKTKSESNTITAPSQPVKVPAGKIYKVEVYFEKKSTAGKVDLFADVLKDGIVFNKFCSLASQLHLAKETYGVIQSPSDPESVRVNGTGTFKVEYGTNLIVKTYDITANPKLQFERSLDLGLESKHLVDSKIIPLKSSN